MNADLFIVTGSVESLKENVRKLDKVIYEAADETKIDWNKVNNLAMEIEESATQLVDESDSEL